MAREPASAAVSPALPVEARAAAKPTLEVVRALLRAPLEVAVERVAVRAEAKAC